MMKIDKKLLVLTSLIILLPVLLGCFFWPQLPKTIATHFDLSGQANGFSSRLFAVFGLPFFLLLLHWFCLFMTSKDPKANNVSSKMHRLIYWIIPLVSCFVMISIYGQAFGYMSNHVLLANLLIGILLITIGNYMPKTRRNYTIGIRLPWTLDNDENWNKTHRLAGKLWVSGGVLIFINAFVQIVVLQVFVIVLAVMIVLPILYSFILNQKKKV